MNTTRPRLFYEKYPAVGEKFPRMGVGARVIQFPLFSHTRANDILSKRVFGHVDGFIDISSVQYCKYVALRTACPPRPIFLFVQPTWMTSRFENGPRLRLCGRQGGTALGVLDDDDGDRSLVQSTGRDGMGTVRAVLRRLMKFHAPEHFYGADHLSPLASKYPFITREAAVLVPLMQCGSDGEWRVLLTQRSQLVRSHKGEVAFPGGVRDRTDRGPVETALREAYEEVGLPYEYVRVAAALVPVLTRHDFLIYPIVGVIENSHFQPSCNPEVAKCFTLPLARFLSDRGHRVTRFRAEQSGREFLAHFFEDTVDGDVQITFGITAVMCMWTAMLVYERKPPFPMYMFEAEEMSLPYDRLPTEYERLLHTYLTRRMEHIETVSRL